MALKDNDAFRAMQARLANLLPRLNERDRRLAMGAEAKSWGRDGISAVHHATGAPRTTIRIKDDFPQLTNDDIKQALLFAAAVDQATIPLPATA